MRDSEQITQVSQLTGNLRYARVDGFTEPFLQQEWEVSLYENGCFHKKWLEWRPVPTVILPFLGG